MSSIKNKSNVIRDLKYLIELKLRLLVKKKTYLGYII